MFYNFDISKFPVVYVTFNHKIKDEKEFDLFLEEWLKLYINKKYFEFVFDTRNLKSDIKYAIKIAGFIKLMKKQPVQYLKKSFIIVDSLFIKSLLDLIFSIQSPAAPVYIWKTNNKDKSQIELVRRRLENENFKNIIKILPS